MPIFYFFFFFFGHNLGIFVPLLEQYLNLKASGPKSTVELIIDFWANKGNLVAMLDFPGGLVVKNPPAKQEMPV